MYIHSEILFHILSFTEFPLQALKKLTLDTKQRIISSKVNKTQDVDGATSTHETHKLCL